MPGNFFDANVVLYLASGDAEKADRAERAIEAGGSISVQALNKLADVAGRKMHLTWEETHAFLALVRSLLSVLPLTEEIHDTGMFLAERYQLSVFDAMVAASALHAKCVTLWSEDMQDGMVIEGRLTILNPFAPTRELIPSTDSAATKAPARAAVKPAVSPTAKLRRERLAAGLCAACGREPVLVGTRCERCAAYQARYHTERRAALRANGLCVNCGKPQALRSTSLCEACLVKASSRTKATKHARRAKGLCGHCDEPALPGEARCAKHKEETLSKYYGRWLEGVCPKCRLPAEPGKTFCSRHLSEARERSRKRARTPHTRP